MQRSSINLSMPVVLPMPIAEQEAARELFQKREGLRIDAYAGTGKTTTLQLLAGSSSQRGLYLAFNRSIAEEAQQRFPQHVACATSHSIAFRSIRRAFGYPEWKLTGALTPNMIAASFKMPESITFRSGVTLPNLLYCSIVLDSIKRYLQSDDENPQRKHIPRYGCLEAIPEDQFDKFTDQAIDHVQVIWNAMRHKSNGLPLSHDGYLKLWALSRPQSNMDYIMVDEAQDLNPVVLGVLQRMECPVIYVGDPYQQIYDWRGAVNAMEQVVTKHRILLSQSFRFGSAIANAATIVLRELGAKQPVRGLLGIESHLSRVRPDVILARSNAGVIGSVLQCLARGVSCHVLGGTRELKRVLEDVKRVKQGAIAQSPELLGFNIWKDVMAFSVQPEGEYLRSFVSLVQEYGEDTMLRAIAKCEKEESKARVVCSTTHKAKGREWNYVRVDSDFDSALMRAFKASSPNRGRGDHQTSLNAEARLLYVAMTRAKIAVHLPRGVMLRYGLTSTTKNTLGRESCVKLPEDGESLQSPDSSLSEVISPYHSPRRGESREMMALRNILR
jgi:superfamily I DNA/RNA helicase